MKQIILFCISFIFNIFSLFSQDIIDIVDPYELKVTRTAQADTFYFSQQNTTANAQKKLDTLRTYDVFLEERPTPFGTAFICNGKEVTKKQYIEYKKFWNAFDACTPCLLYTYNDKNELKYSAYQYKSCLCGEYKEYYPDNILKVEGQFKENRLGNLDFFKSKNLCNLRDGIWTYYNEDGTVDRTETYIDGKLKETFNKTSVNSNTIETDKSTQVAFRNCS